MTADSICCLFLGLVYIIASGCSNQPTTYPIKGKVRFSDGTPVQFGEIETFEAGSKLNSRGKIQKDGSFQLGTFAENDGVVAGKHKVVITQFSASPISGNVKFDTIEHDHGHQLDTRYQSYANSNLEFEVIPGVANEVNLEIEDFTPASKHPH